MSRIMITGASGAFGHLVVESLRKNHPEHQVVALARDPQALADFADSGVDVRHGDYDNPTSLEHAFEGVGKLLLISARAFTDVKTAHRNVIHAARAAGVRHIHYTAIQHRSGSDFEIPQVTEWDTYTEKELTASGLDLTILRNSQYLDSFDALIGELPADGVIRVPAGTAPTALATRRDMADATAAVLASDGHEGRAYTLAGSRAFTLDDVTEILSDITGTSVTYQDTPLADFVAARTAEGMPEPWARFAGAWFQASATGQFSPTNDIEQLTGRPSTPLREFLTQQRAS